MRKGEKIIDKNKENIKKRTLKREGVSFAELGTP
jgi:hypothetical protein